MDFNMVIRYRNDEESVNYDRVVLMEPFFFFSMANIYSQGAFLSIEVGLYGHVTTQE